MDKYEVLKAVCGMKGVSLRSIFLITDIKNSALKELGMEECQVEPLFWFIFFKRIFCNNLPNETFYFYPKHFKKIDDKKTSDM